LGGDEFEAEGGGVMQAGQLLASHFLLLFLEDFGVEGLPVFEQVPGVDPV
jgi:hypothetical protein